ncbi:MAG: peptide chain release factor N(5)-glutamine methyltransferase [Muribaculaceae bacterium]|nr:peptide chain release factor N(5)-glutamine methyltransferase [Muribaculaceae bacterium]
MTTREAILLLRSELNAYYDSREIEGMTRVIFEDVLLWQPVDILMRENEQLPEFFDRRLANIIDRLKRYEPLQYILGKARFHGHSFAVTPAVLIPRPETEQLVDMIIDENPGSDLDVLDIGTGSGCIAISLARALKFARVTATDISLAALEVAQRNADELKTRVKFIEQDILACRAPSEAWDIIVSNPPYITEQEKAAMAPNVLDYEPHSALFVPDGDPMLFYRPIAAYASRALKNGGRLYLEINRAMGNLVGETLQRAGLSNIQIYNDFNGNVRFVTAIKKDNY